MQEHEPCSAAASPSIVGSARGRLSMRSTHGDDRREAGILKAIRMSESRIDAWSVLLSGANQYTVDQLRRHIDLAEPPDFLEFTVSILEKDLPSGRPGSLGSLLLSSGIVARAVCEASILDRAHAMALAGLAARLDTLFDTRILNYLSALGSDPQQENVLRGLEVVESISDCSRLVFGLMRFLSSPEGHVRSKVAKLIGRGTQNAGWVERAFADLDPRVRSNLLEGIASQPGQWPPHVFNLLRKGARDPHHRVAVTSLALLCRAGDEESCRALHALRDHPDTQFQRAAAWAITRLSGNQLKHTNGESSVA